MSGGSRGGGGGGVSFTTKLFQEDGIAVVDVRFAKNIAPAVHLQFQNYYVHRMDCLVKDGDEWKPLTTDIVLMPSPHQEDGAQDHIHIHLHSDSEETHTFAQTRSHQPPLTCATSANQDVTLRLGFPKDAKVLRLILSQPSPLWKAFGVRHMRATATQPATSDDISRVKEEATSAPLYTAPNLKKQHLSKHTQLQRVQHTLTSVSHAVG